MGVFLLSAKKTDDAKTPLLPEHPEAAGFFLIVLVVVVVLGLLVRKAIEDDANIFLPCGFL
jgi:hypothetical protein